MLVSLIFFARLVIHTQMMRLLLFFSCMLLLLLQTTNARTCTTDVIIEDARRQICVDQGAKGLVGTIRDASYTPPQTVYGTGSSPVVYYGATSPAFNPPQSGVITSAVYFSVGYDYTTALISDFGPQSFPVVSSSVALQRSESRGVAMCGGTTTLDFGFANALLIGKKGWTLSMWLSAPNSFSSTSSIIDGFLTYPWALLGQSFSSPNQFVNGWGFLVISASGYTGETTVYWNGQAVTSFILNQWYIFPETVVIDSTNFCLDNVTLWQTRFSADQVSALYQSSSSPSPWLVHHAQVQGSVLAEQVSGSPFVLAMQVLNSVGVDSTRSIGYMGAGSAVTWSGNIPGCTDYTWSTWIKVEDGVSLANVVAQFALGYTFGFQYNPNIGGPATDNNGYVYLTDYALGYVMKVTSHGQQMLMFPTTVGSHPFAIDVDTSSSSIWTLEGAPNGVVNAVKYSSTGSMVFGFQAYSTYNQFSYSSSYYQPQGAIVAYNGRITTFQGANSPAQATISSWDATSGASLWTASQGLTAVSGLAFDGSSTLYVSNNQAPGNGNGGINIVMFQAMTGSYVGTLPMPNNQMGVGGSLCFDGVGSLWMISQSGGVWTYSSSAWSQKAIIPARDAVTLISGGIAWNSVTNEIVASVTPNVYTFAASSGAMTQNRLTNPLPMNFLLLGCGFAVWSTNVKAFDQNKWMHIGISYYDGMNDFFINGARVFSWQAFQDPPDDPYFYGNIYINVPQGVLMADTKAYCAALTDEQMKIAMLAQYDPDRQSDPFPLGANDLLPGSAMPAFEYPFTFDNDYIRAAFCMNPTSTSTLPTSVPATYAQVYVSQQFGTSTSAGTMEDPYPDISSVYFLGNLFMSVPLITGIRASDSGLDNTVMTNGVASSLTAWDGAGGAGAFALGATCAYNPVPQIQASFSDPVLVQGGLPNGCNSLQYTTNTVSAYSFPYALGGSIMHGVTSSATLQVLDMSPGQTASVGVSYNHNGNSPGGLMITGGADGLSYTLSLTIGAYTVSIVRQYSHTFFHAIGTLSVMGGGMSLYIDGVQVSYVDVPNGLTIGMPWNSPSVMQVPCGAGFMGQVGQINWHDAWLPSGAAWGLYQFLSQPMSCDLAQIGLELNFCAGDRYYNQQPLSIMQGTADLAVVIKGYDCGGDNDVWPLISGGALLPQTQEIGWESGPWVSPLVGVTFENVLWYNMTQLWELSGTTFLPGDPRLNVWSPIVHNTMYNIPRAPNLDDPLYPWGELYNHTFHMVWNLYSNEVAGARFQEMGAACMTPNGPTNTPNTCAILEFAPGSWCDYWLNHQMRGSQAAYDAFFINSDQTVLTEIMRQFTLSYDFTGYSPGQQDFGWWPSDLNCTLWYETEVNNPNNPSSTPNYQWGDHGMLNLGVWPSHLNQPGYNCPVSTASGEYYASGEYTDLINSSPNGQDTLIYNGAPPFAPNPHGQAQGGYSQGDSWYTSGLATSSMMFDGVGESWYDNVNGILYVIPWDEWHRAGLMQRSTTLSISNPVKIFYSHDETEAWSRVSNLSPLTSMSPGTTGLVNGYTWLGAYYSNPFDFVADLLIQEMEFSMYNGISAYPIGDNYWALDLTASGNIVLQSVSVHHWGNGVQMTTTGAGSIFLVNSTVANYTGMINPRSFESQPSGGVYGTAIGVDAQGSGSTSFINVTVYNMLTINSEPDTWIRGFNAYAVWGQAIFGNPRYMEHSLFNNTQSQCGDCGIIYATSQYMTWRYVSIDGLEQSIATAKHEEQVYTFNTGKGETDRAFYWYQGSTVLHGCQFEHFLGDIQGLYSDSDYNYGVMQEFTTILYSGGSSQWWKPDVAGPKTTTGGLGRPWTVNNTLTVYDTAYASPLATPWSEYTMYPAYQATAQAYKWNPDTSYAYIADYNICYGMLEVVNGQPQFSSPAYVPVVGGSGTSFSGVGAQVLLNFAADVADAAASSNPSPEAGFATCQNRVDNFKQEINNEAIAHWKSSEPMIQAIVRTAMPFDLPLNLQVSADAGVWAPSVDLYMANIVDNPWPSRNELIDHCTDLASCQPFVAAKILPQTTSSGGSLWYDPTGQANSISLQYEATGCNWGRPSANYAGSSWDVDRGAVVDLTMNYHFSYSFQMPGRYTSYTVMFWMLLPDVTQGSPGFVMSNSPTTYLDSIISSNPPAFGLYYSGATVLNSTAWMDNSWHHYIVVVDGRFNQVLMYMDGQLGGANSANFIIGGSGNNVYLFDAMVRIADFTIIAGAFTDSTVSQLYNDAQTPLIPLPTAGYPSSGTVVNIVWSSQSQAFVNSYNPNAPALTLSNTLPATTLPAPNSCLVYIDTPSPSTSASSPDGSGAIVINQGAQFSVATPAISSAWTLEISAWWTAAPSNTYWFHARRNEVTSFVMQVVSSTQMCLLTTISTNKQTPVSSSCITITSIPLNQWTDFLWSFDPNSGSVSLSINGQSQANGFTSPAMSTALLGVLQFANPDWVAGMDYRNNGNMLGVPSAFLASLKIGV